MRWHFLTTGPAGGPHNMAVDEALMRATARSGHAVFRVYTWSEPTLSLGRNQRARGLYNLPEASRLGVSFVRRPTGGRALLHHREITYSAALPAAGVADAHRAYDFINEVLLSGLERLGVPAVLATGTQSLPPGPRPCFGVPAEREIAVGARKLVGSAQWRHEGVVLQHGSILVRDDQSAIPELMLHSEPAPAPVPATLADVLGREPDPDEASALLRRALDDATGSPSEDFQLDDVLRADVDRLTECYGDDSWTWRR